MILHELARKLLELNDMEVMLPRKNPKNGITITYLEGFSIATENHVDLGSLKDIVYLKGKVDEF